MDGCSSWMLLQAAAGGGDPLRHHHQDEQEALGSQAMQQQLSQICMLMDMEEHDQYAAVAPPAPALPPLPSSSSSSFRSFYSGDDKSSSLMLTATSTTAAAASCQNHHQEVSSQMMLPVSFSPSMIVSGAAAAAVDVPNLQPEYSVSVGHQHQESQARCSSRSSGGHGAFRPYSRCLGPKKKLCPGGTAGGQRAIKTAVSVLSRMHAVRLAQYYQMMTAAQARPSPATVSSCDNNYQLQVQHVLSERKRREKLNDSFKALRAVLPPGHKKDKASVLIRAKDYVNALMARITELEENNKIMLAEVQQQQQRSNGGDEGGNGGNDGGDGDGEKDDEVIPEGDKEEADVVVGTDDDGGAAAAPDQCQELHLKILLESSSGCSAMDAVAGILQGLTERRGVSLLAMNRGGGGGSSRLPRAQSSPPPAVKLQLKSRSRDEEILKESVIKAVKDVLQSKSTVTP